MQIATRHFGVIEVEDEKLLTFPKGMIGFESARTFSLIGKPEAAPYYWLQCVNLPELTFVVVAAALVRPDYHLHLSQEDLARLKLGAEDTPLVLTVVVVTEDPNDSTVNLLAPVVINERERLGGQVVNETADYRIRHRLRDEVKPRAKEGQSHAGAHEEKETVADAR